MGRLRYTVEIGAPKERVWRTILEDATYRRWASAFHEGSYAVTDWREGSKALFLGPDGGGMVSRIAAHRPNEFLSIEHLGMVKDGVEDTESEAVKAWAGGLENYTVREQGGVTTLTVDMDAPEDFRSYLEGTWPKALSILKDLAEREVR